MLGLLVPVGCSGAATGTPTNADTGSVSGPGTAEPQVTLPAGASPQAGAALPADPCAPTIAAIKSLGWSVTKTEAGPGPGGPNTQCTFEADRGDNSVDNGWVAYIPASQMSFEYHQPEHDRRRRGRGVPRFAAERRDPGHRSEPWVPPVRGERRRCRPQVREGARERELMGGRVLGQALSLDFLIQSS